MSEQTSQPDAKNQGGTFKQKKFDQISSPVITEENFPRILEEYLMQYSLLVPSGATEVRVMFNKKLK